MMFELGFFFFRFLFLCVIFSSYQGRVSMILKDMQLEREINNSLTSLRLRDRGNLYSLVVTIILVVAAAKVLIVL